jgi:hypothetical protein
MGRWSAKASARMGMRDGKASVGKRRLGINALAKTNVRARLEANSKNIKALFFAIAAQLWVKLAHYVKTRVKSKPGGGYHSKPAVVT